LALDPRSVETQGRLALALATRVLNRMSDTRALDIARAEQLVEEALATLPRNPFVHSAKGQVLRCRGRCREAALEFETVIASDPNAAFVRAWLGLCKLLTGSIAETIPLLQQAIRLSPRDARIGIWYDWIGRVHLLQSRTDEAIRWFERARIANPEQPFPPAYLASAYALGGETKRAAAELAEARKLFRNDWLSSIAHVRRFSGFGASGYWGVPEVRRLFEETYFAGLRGAVAICVGI
jgi:predicted Zn-dependent protease